MKSTHQKNIKVSVIIPTYNCLKYLPTAIKSVVDQNIEDYEMLIADDNSTDGTWEWLQKQQSMNTRIRPIKLNDVGPAVARNTCIAKSYGDYIAFLDADDHWLKGKLAIQLAFMDKHPDMVMSFTDYRHIDPQANNLGTAFNFWSKFRKIADNTCHTNILTNPLPVIFAENIIGTSTVIARQNALQNANGYDETICSSEDWDLWLKLCKIGKIGFVNQVLTNYLMRPDSETSKLNQRIQSLNTIIERYLSDVTILDKRAIKFAKARLIVAKAEHFQISGNYIRAFLAHLQANLLAPNRRTMRSMLLDGINTVRYLHKTVL